MDCSDREGWWYHEGVGHEAPEATTVARNLRRRGHEAHEATQVGSDREGWWYHKGVDHEPEEAGERPVHLFDSFVPGGNYSNL